MSKDKEREFVCAYKYCLHHGERVKDSAAVVINQKHYHWDCAAMKREINDCADLYTSYVEDKSLFPTACRIINNLVFKNKVPIEFIYNKIKNGGSFYSDKPVYILYGLRKLFWEKEV